MPNQPECLLATYNKGNLHTWEVITTKGSKHSHHLPQTPPPPFVNLVSFSLHNYQAVSQHILSLHISLNFLQMESYNKRSDPLELPPLIIVLKFAHIAV